MAPTDELRPSPQFWTFLAAFPHPVTVPRAMALGPLSNFSTKGAFLAFPHEAGYLRTMGGYGFTDEEMDRYAIVPLSMASPMAEAYLSSEVLIMPFSDLPTRYEVVRIDPEIWNQMEDRFGGGDVVHVPVTAQGTTLGVMGFYTDVRRVWTSKDVSYLEGLCAAVGIWATHPLSGVQTPDIWRPVGETMLVLSDRQQVILRMVESGKSNAAIAMALGYSPSTVKAEIQKILRTLKVNDRAAAAERARELGLLDDEQDVDAG